MVRSADTPATTTSILQALSRATLGRELGRCRGSESRGLRPRKRSRDRSRLTSQREAASIPSPTLTAVCQDNEEKHSVGRWDLASEGKTSSVAGHVGEGIEREEEPDKGRLEITPSPRLAPVEIFYRLEGTAGTVETAERVVPAGTAPVSRHGSMQNDDDIQDVRDDDDAHFAAAAMGVVPTDKASPVGDRAASGDDDYPGPGIDPLPFVSGVDVATSSSHGLISSPPRVYYAQKPSGCGTGKGDDAAGIEHLQEDVDKACSRMEGFGPACPVSSDRNWEGWSGPPGKVWAECEDMAAVQGGQEHEGNGGKSIAFVRSGVDSRVSEDHGGDEPARSVTGNMVSMVSEGLAGEVGRWRQGTKCVTGERNDQREPLTVTDLMKDESLKEAFAARGRHKKGPVLAR